MNKYTVIFLDDEDEEMKVTVSQYSPIEAIKDVKNIMGSCFGKLLRVEQE